MRTFPPIAEIPAFEGDAIAQIWLDPYGVRFVFESMKQLYAETRIEHIESDGTRWEYACEAAGGPPIALHRLLYKPIVSVKRNELELLFVFEDGSILSVYSELGPYESGHINTPEGSFLVF